VSLMARQWHTRQQQGCIDRESKRDGRWNVLDPSPIGLEGHDAGEVQFFIVLTMKKLKLGLVLVSLRLEVRVDASDEVAECEVFDAVHHFGPCRFSVWKSSVLVPSSLVTVYGMLLRL